MKVAYVTNIPTPYRTARFNILNDEINRRGGSLDVLFMAQIEPDRNWDIDYKLMNFPYKVYKGVHPTIKGMFAHFNPGLLFDLWRKKWDVVVIGGMGSPTHILSPFFVRSSALRVMSVESNLDSTRIKRGFGAYVKKILLDRSDAYQVTGTRQVELIRFFCPSAVNKSYVRLPNLINEDLFCASRFGDADKEGVRLRFNVSKSERLWVLPARLSSEKGILEFLEAFDPRLNVRLLVLGVGPLLEEIRSFVNARGINATLLGFVQEKEMASIYAAADFFVLPSLRDPSPLSPIEAIRMGLPLLVSNRIGNFDDVFDANNGFSFDPASGESVKNAIDRAAACSIDVVSEMRAASLNLYAKNFNAQDCVARYVDDLDRVLSQR